jgi:hypothetical protein
VLLSGLKWPKSRRVSSKLLRKFFASFAFPRFFKKWFLQSDIHTIIFDNIWNFRIHIQHAWATHENTIIRYRHEKSTFKRCEISNVNNNHYPCCLARAGHLIISGENPLLPKTWACKCTGSNQRQSRTQSMLVRMLGAGSVIEVDISSLRDLSRLAWSYFWKSTFFRNEWSLLCCYRHTVPLLHYWYCIRK